MLEKTYNPQDIEQRMAALWEQHQAFRAGQPDRLQAEPFSIMIPPPNVTGSLHMGHALNNTLQDILCRFERMRGKDVLWQVGTDHAGIATQMVVERQLAAAGKADRRQMGREAFLKEVWDWKNQSGNVIQGQLKRLGASCDWSRERFTMDEGLSRAVTEIFVRLHDAGLIYRDKRLVNWDPKLLTAISDLEVQQIELKGHLWHLRYPIEGTDQHIIVATTRPETMLGDTAVAVHPEDERYRHLVGRSVRLPLVGRLIPIVADTYSDPEKGSGAVKITPAHDFNDFEVGRRHDLPMINIFDAEAKLTQDVPEPWRGLDRFAARKAIVAALEEQGLLETIEPHTHMVPHGDRSGVPVEPWLTDQWYVNVQPLAEKALEAVRKGETRFVPENWEKTYFDWLENIQPWCISRQLWWGHQIPVWYGPDGAYVVARTSAEASEKARLKWGHDVALTQDEDVLDTWFSSALWPYSTLGWPEETPELKRYYPTSVLITGFDIIFFWVARMMMTGVFTQGEVPFRDVYIHALVRDERGQKMSKSKGNVIDPLDLIDSYGADALRFTLAAFAAQGRDIKMSASRVEGYRNFATKLWNATRFAQMNGCVRQAEFDPARVSSPVNQWIVAETHTAIHDITASLEAYRFNDAASGAYRFVWNILCDWYLELIKPVLQTQGAPDQPETQATAAWVLDQALKLLHPFMPFITEEIWQVTGQNALLTLTPWPDPQETQSGEAQRDIRWLIELVSAIRSVRAEMNIAPGLQIPLVMVASPQTWARVQRLEDKLRRLARISQITAAEAPPEASVQLVVEGETLALPLEGVIDFDAERARLDKDLSRVNADLEKINAKLGNQQFVARAPEEVIEEYKERLAETLARQSKLTEALNRLK